MIYLLFKQVLIMFLLVGVGYICFRKNKITLEGSRNIANILIYLSLPCVIINSFLVTFSYEKLIEKNIISEHKSQEQVLIKDENVKVEDLNLDLGTLSKEETLNLVIKHFKLGE